MHRLHFLLTGLLTCTVSLSAQILDATPIPSDKIVTTQVKPTAPLVGISTATGTVARRFAVWDGMQVTKPVFNFAPQAALEIRSDRMNGWMLSPKAPFAIGFTNPLTQQAYCGINYATGAAAQALLAGTAWDSIPSNLTRGAKDSVRVLVNDDSAVNPSVTRIFGWRTRVCEREIISGVPGTPLQSQVLVAIGDGTRAYLFTLEGPSSDVKRASDSFARLLIALELPSS